MAGNSVRSRKRKALLLLLAPISLILAIFFLIPLGIVVVYSFLEPGLYGGVEWTWYPFNYGRILGWPLNDFEEFDPIYLEIFANSLKFAFLTVLFSLLICYPAAFWVSRMSPRRKGFVMFLITLPFFASLLIRIYAWLLLLRPSGFISTVLETLGLIGQPLDMMFTGSAVVLGMVYVFTPFMFLPIYANVEKLDYALVRASQDLGAGPVDTFRRVILPLTAPGIMAGSIIVFIPALGNFIIPSFLGGSKVQMTGNLIERAFLQSRDWPFGAALALLIMASVLLVLMFYTLRSAPAQERGAA